MGGGGCPTVLFNFHCQGISEMNGQWIGRYTGANSGIAIINIDDLGEHYEGVAYLHDDNPGLPSIAAAFETSDKSKNFKFRTNKIWPINPTTGMPDLWDNVKQLYEGIDLIWGYVDVEGEWNKKTLNITMDKQSPETRVPVYYRKARLIYHRNINQYQKLMTGTVISNTLMINTCLL